MATEVDGRSGLTLQITRRFVFGELLVIGKDDAGLVTECGLIAHQPQPRRLDDPEHRVLQRRIDVLELLQDVREALHIEPPDARRLRRRQWPTAPLALQALNDMPVLFITMNRKSDIAAVQQRAPMPRDRRGDEIQVQIVIVDIPQTASADAIHVVISQRHRAVMA